MINTTPANKISRRSGAGLLAGLLCLATFACQAAPNMQEHKKMTGISPSSQTLSDRQQAIVPIAAFAASGEMTRLSDALYQGLEAGLSVSEIKEVLVQVYAYAGFPRSLNALGEFMKVLEARKQRGIADAAGREPIQTIPKGDALLVAGTANQTKLAGGPVKGPLFDFAPAIDEYLKTHLFGDIFERDNLDWGSREIGTIAMLSALSGVESQLQSHIAIGMNVGLTMQQLYALARVLGEQVGADSEGRVSAALQTHQLRRSARMTGHAVMDQPLVRLFELRTDPAKSQAFTSAGRHNIGASLREEPDVLAMHAVVSQDDPGLAYVLEIYADDAAYRRHVDTTHYKRFLETTRALVSDKSLIETEPAFLAEKSGSLSIMESGNAPEVRIVEVTVKHKDIDDFRRVVTTEMRKSMKVEPGVLAMYAVIRKGRPEQWIFFEIYTDAAAYASHRDTTHFQEYLRLTGDMLLSKGHIEVEKEIALQYRGGMLFDPPGNRP